MKKVFFILVLILVTVFMSCSYNDADTKLAEQTSKLMDESNRQVGMPNIVNFQQKKTLKMIYELADKEDLICYAYLYNQYEGKIGQFLGKCIGYGIPFSAQYSNPQVWKRVHAQEEVGHSYTSMPQPEPNGLFMPTSSSATWLIMVDPETNKPRPVYIEPLIVVSPFPLN